MIKTNFSEEEILDNRIAIKDEFLKTFNLNSEHLQNTKNSAMYLQCLFHLYDKYFFHHFFDNHNIQTTFRFSNKMTSSAGCVSYVRYADMLDYYSKNPLKFKFSAYYIFRNFSYKGSTEVVNGITAFSRLEVLMYVMEHEIMHVIDRILYGKSGHNYRFKKLCYNCFRHTEIFHSISNDDFLREDIAANISESDNIKKIFEKNAKKIEISKDWFGKKMKINNTIYTIFKINPRNYKYPIIAKSKTGKMFKLSKRQTIKYMI
jgi:hypothetical protein